MTTDLRVTDEGTLTGAGVADGDLVEFFDISDATAPGGGAAGSWKGMTVVEAAKAYAARIPAFLGGIVIPYTFDTTTTDADPGAGKLRLSNATQLSATVIRADLSDNRGTDWTAVLGTFAASTNAVKGLITLSKQFDMTKYIMFSVSAVASPTGYKNITVTEVGASGANPFTNGDLLFLSFARAGDAGTAGVGTGNSGMTDAQQMQFVDYTAGNDSNDGLSWATARKTFAAAKAHIAVGQDGGEIFLSMNGAHVMSSAVEVPTGVGLHGAKPGTIAGSYGGSVVILWQGADSGYVIKTGDVTASGDPSVGYDFSTIDGITIMIPKAGGSHQGDPGGGNPNAGGAAYTTIIPFGLRNWQNLCEIRDCVTVGAPNIGFHWYSESGGGRTDSPGWCAARRCWVLGNANGLAGKYPFYQEAGVLNMIYDECGADAGVDTLDTFTIAPNPEGGSGVRQIVSFRDCKVEGSGDTAHGAAMGVAGVNGDCGFIHVLSGAAVNLVITGGCAQMQGGTAAASPCIKYDAVPTQANSRASGAPITINGLLSQSFATWISCPNATPPILVKPPNGASGGTVDHWPNFDFMAPEWAWSGKVASDQTTTGQALVNVAGLSVPLDANHLYEFEAFMLVATSAVTTGTQYGVQFSAAGAGVEALVEGHTTQTAVSPCGLSVLNTATTVTYLTVSSQGGIIRIKGMIATGSNAGNLTIQHLKVTSGTSTVRAGSYLNVHQLT